MHLYSTLFTAQTVSKDLSTEEGLKKAAEWAKESKLHKLYVESFRGGLFIEQELLEKVRDYFQNEGFIVHGCVTTTGLPRISNNWKDGCCYSAPETREMVTKIFDRTARVFDVIMIDDFLFTDCTCELCDKARGERSFDDYHSDIMHEVAVENILKPAHLANPKCKVIIKYPLWYENFHRNGYDTVRQTRDFDLIWAGTETREPQSKRWGRYPQTNAFYFMEWANKLGKGKCMGGWFDPYSTKPITYLDQARQTVLAQAKESMLFCYGSLIVENGDPEKYDEGYTPGISNTEALRKERPALEKLAYLIETKKIVGVSVPKMPHYDAKKERFLSSFYGMIGIPVNPDVELDPCAPSVILGSQAVGYPGIRDYYLKRKSEGKATAFTQGFCEQLGCFDEPCVIDIAKYGREETLQLSEGATPADNWNIIRMPEGELNKLRDTLTKPLGLTFRAPVKVALNLYDDDMEVIQNFNDEPIEVTLDLFGRNAKARQILLTLSEDQQAELLRCGSIYTVKIPARTYVVLG